jgi:hypothetical protein
MAEGGVVEGIDDDVALQVVVRAEPLGGGKEALEVDVFIHEAIDDPSWAAGMLRQIADDLEPSGSSTDEPPGGAGAHHVACYLTWKEIGDHEGGKFCDCRCHSGDGSAS